MTKIYIIKGDRCISDILDFELEPAYVNTNNVTVVKGLYTAKAEYSYDLRKSRKYAVMELVNGDKYCIDEDSYLKIIGSNNEL